MFHNLLILFRQIRRDAFFNILMIGGLSIGFSVFIVLLSMVRKEFSYDEFWPVKNKLYRVALEKYYQGELQIGATWSDTYPGENFLYSSLDNSYLEQYKADRAFGRSFMIAAILAILVSCLGLLGLTRYNALKRTGEIGVRKTFGASSANILYLLQSESLILILFSIILGIPLAWIIVNRWLENFAYHIDPAWWMFLLAIFITFLVAVLSVLFISIKTSRANPVDSLRYE